MSVHVVNRLPDLHPHKHLASWRVLNAWLRTATEQQIHRAIAEEGAGQARLQFLLRIHGAFNKRRYARERMELTKAAKLV